MKKTICILLALAMLTALLSVSALAAKDDTPPTLTGLQLSASTVEAGGEVEITASATDDLTGVSQIDVYFVDDVNGRELSAGLSHDKDDESILRGSLFIGEYTPTGNYAVREINVFDNADNMYSYGRSEDLGDDELLPSYAASLTLSVINEGAADITAPVLTGLQLAASTVDAGGEIEVIADAADDLSGVASVDVFFSNGDEENELCCSLLPTDDDDQPYADGKLHGTIMVEPYAAGGVYSLSSIYVYDNAGNCVFYCDEPEDEKAEPVPSFAASLTVEVFNDGETDTTAPVLTGLQLSASAVAVGGTIEVIADAEDDLSGAANGVVGFYSENGACLYCSVDDGYYDEDGEYIPYADGRLHGTLTVDTNDTTGTYVLTEIDIMDNAGNEMFYSSDPEAEADAPLPAFAASLTIEVRVDTTGPVLTGLQLSASTVKAGGTIEITADATDDLSGVAGGLVCFYKSEGGDLYCDLSSEYYDEDSGEYVPYADGRLHGTLTIDTWRASGTYALQEVDVTDHADNVTSYSSDPDGENVGQLPSFAASKTIEVINDGENDTTGPVLTGLELSASTVKAGGTIEITADATDDLSGAAGAFVYFYKSEGGDLYCNLSSEYYDEDSGEYVPYADGRLHGTMTIDTWRAAGTYALQGVNVTDHADNVTIYYANLAPENVTLLPSFAASLTIEVINYNETDTAGPVLTGLQLSASTVKAGGTIEITADATDDLTGASSCYLGFYTEEGCLFASLSSETYDKNADRYIPYADGKLHGTLKVDPDAAVGVYYLKEVNIMDEAGNSTIYGYDHIPLPSFAASISFTVNGDSSTTGWSQENGSWYYTENGRLLADTTAVIGGAAYVFRADGRMISGWGQTSDGSWYYCNTSGVMQTGWKYIGSAWYYLDPDTGVMACNKWVGSYYMNGSGVMVTGWQWIDGAWYYFNASGLKQTDWKYIGNAWYYLGDDGRMRAGEWAGSYYLTSSGAMAYNWQWIGDAWYYFGSSGVLRTGWQYIGNTWYYLDPADGHMWAGAWVGSYYLTSSGAMAYNWQWIGDAWYYFGSSGVLRTGWQYIGNTWYYLDPADGHMWAGDWLGGYYLTSSGAMATGWQWIGSAWYYFGSDGVMRTGWQYIGNAWYYMDPYSGGAMAANTVIEIDGFLCRFSAGGVWTGYVTE